MSDSKTEQRVANKLAAAVRPAESLFVAKTIGDRLSKDRPKWADLADDSPKAGGAQNQYDLAENSPFAAVQDSEGGQSEQAAVDGSAQAQSAQDSAAVESAESVSNVDEAPQSTANAVQDSTTDSGSGSLNLQGKGSQWYPTKGKGKDKASNGAQEGQGKGPQTHLGHGKGVGKDKASNGAQKGQGKGLQAHSGKGKGKGKGFKKSFHIPIDIEEFSWEGINRFIGTLIIGYRGANMKAILAECNNQCKLRLVGDGSGAENQDGSESTGPLTLCVSCFSVAAYEMAWIKAGELIAEVHAKYDQHCIDNNKPRRQLEVNVIAGCRQQSC